MTDDEQRLGEIANALADGLDQHLGPWLAQLIALRSGGAASSDEIRATVDAVAPTVLDQVRRLLQADIDEQRANPLDLVRRGLGPVTELLRALEVSPVDRDPFAVQTFPDDLYDLAPATFADIDEALHEPGLMWGAAKAHVHLSRRRAEGLR